VSTAVATVLRFMLATATGEGDGAAELLHDEIEVHDFDLPDAGIYHGLEGVGRWLADWDAPWEEWSGHVHDFLDLGSQVATLNHLRARTGSGLAVDREDSQLFTMRDGKIAKLEYFGEAGTALERCHDPARAAARKQVHEKIRAVYAAALREDIEAAVALLHPDYEFHPEEGAPMDVTYIGHEGARRYFREAFEAWEFLEFDLERLVDAGDRVALLFEMRNRGRGSGIELSGRWGEVWETDGTDLISSRNFQSHEEALAAAGLRG
jgi:ketosteroid isomerase-like protein